MASTSTYAPVSAGTISEQKLQTLQNARLIQHEHGTLIAASYLRLKGWSIDAAVFYLVQKMQAGNRK